MLHILALVAVLPTQAIAQDTYVEAASSDHGPTSTPEQTGDGVDQPTYTTDVSESFSSSFTSESQATAATSEPETAYPTGTSPLGQPLPDYVQIKYASDPSKCLAVFDTSGQPGTPVVLKDCAWSDFESRHETQWMIDQTEPTRVISRVYEDQPWCLDAVDTDNRVPHVTISPCDYENPAQIWQYIYKHLVVYSKTPCVDLTDGITTGGGDLQTWDYTYGNTHQEWNIEDAPLDSPAS